MPDQKGLNSYSQRKFKYMLGFVFSLCFAYWTYLIFNTTMAIKFDSLGYQELGLMIYEKGWIEYFKTGPHREPLYPWTIATSMYFGDMFSVPYQLIQKIFQVGVLFATQCLTLLLLCKMRVHNSLKLGTVFYVGFSPALVNSAFSLFSEVLIGPAVLAIIYFNYLAWKAVSQGSSREVVWLSLCVTLSFLFAIFGKGVFQYIFIIFLMPYAFLAGHSFFKMKRKVFFRSVLFIFITVFAVNSAVISFKFANKKYNGKFEFTTRGAQLLYGNAVKRTDQISQRIFLAHIASIPGGGVCRKFFSEEECRYCEFSQADSSRGAITGLLKGVPEEKSSAKTLLFAFDRFKERPGQYLTLMGIESLRMPFWESSQLGFVAYPVWLKKIFDLSVFKNGIRLCVSVLTYLALCFGCVQIFTKRKVLADAGISRSNEVQIIAFIFLMIIAYTGLYSLFSIVTRYALVVAPLYLIMIAFFLETILFQSKSSRKI